MTKILFLDFDGVLNDYSYNNTEHFASNKEYFHQKKSAKNFIFNNLKDNNSLSLWVLSDLDYCKVRLLNQVVNKTDCKIVFSTSWRGDGANNLALYLAIMGFMYPENCIDCTGYGRNGIRGLEITDWLVKYTKEHGEDIHYAILDDEMFDITNYHSTEKLFKTDGKTAGITKEIVDSLIEYFNKTDEQEKVDDKEGSPCTM